MRINPIAIFAGMMLIVSPFLPFLIMSDSQFNLLMFIFYSQANEYWVLSLIATVTLIFLVAGGVICFVNGVVGGALSFLGLLPPTVLWAIVIFERPAYLLVSVGPSYGFILAWIGCIVAFGSHYYRPSPPPLAAPQPFAT